MVFGLEFATDIDKAISVITAAAATDKRVYKQPAPWAKLVNIGESTLDIELRIWCDYDDYAKSEWTYPNLSGGPG